MERLQCIGFFADTQEFNRFTGDMADRQRRTAARITIDFSQHHTGQRQGFVEGFGGVCRILTGHGIHDEQGFDRVNRRMQLFDFPHHAFIDMQTTRGIHQQDIKELQLRMFQRFLSDINWLL